MGKTTLERDFHMVGGTGESSYAANSVLQKGIASGAMFMVKESLKSLVMSIPSSERLLVIADLGCPTGANTFFMLSELMNVISETCNKLSRPVPEIQLLLNDLPGNDFNTLLGPVLSSYKEEMKESTIDKSMPFYTAGVPGSFYERLFPKRSVHFIYTSMSLHWLSQVPPGLNSATGGPMNKNSIWISKKSPFVSKLYFEQFQKDFSSFLKHRSEELCSEGYMVLVLWARTSAEPSVEESAVWISCFDEALYELASQGIVKASDVDSFNLPLYQPSIEEAKSIIEMEGSFEVVQHYVSGVLQSNNLGNTCRAALEPLLVSHFGDSIIDPLFSIIPKTFVKQLRIEEYKFNWIAISVKKK